jgi:histidinol-phosphate aminotransferase
MTKSRIQVDNLVRPNIRRLIPYRCARAEVKEGILLDANENPFEHNLQDVSINRYPDPHQTELRAALARYVGIEADRILAGNGSDEILDWVLKVFCSPGKDRLAVTPPTYGMYRVTADILGVELFSFPLDGEFQFRADRFLESVPNDVKVLILCSPNNPTGNLLRSAEILRAANRWKGIVLVDEAYIEFSESPSIVSETLENPNLVVVRTFSKALGRAGIRLGYVVASPNLIEYFLRVKMPYNLNSFTLSQGIEALELQKAEWERKQIICERERITSRLENMAGVKRVYPSEANFILFKCENASGIYRKLFEQGIVIRDRSKVNGLEDCLRVSIGTAEENQRFLSALEILLRDGEIRGEKK